VFTEVPEVGNHQPLLPGFGRCLGATGWRADCAVEMVAYFMKERVREREVPYDRDVNQEADTWREMGCNDVIDNNFDLSWFALPFVVIPSKAGVSEIFPPLDSMGLSSADSAGVRQDDGLQAQQVVLWQRR
jgi:hypothetical protein